MRGRSPTLVVFLAGALLAGALLAGARAVRAQAGATFTASDPQVEALLEQALLDEGRGDWDRAARRYLEVEERLDQLRTEAARRDEGAPLTEVGPGLDRGVSAWLAERVAALPPDALAVYRTTIDPRAREALRAALAAGDLEALEALVARWPQAGCVEEALRAVADRAFERGELGRAERALRRVEALVAGPQGSQAPPAEPERARRVALQRLLCALAGADRRAAEEALHDFEARGGDAGAEREVGGRRVALRALVARLPARGAPGEASAAGGFDPGGLLRTVPLERPELPRELRRPGAACLEPLRDPLAPRLYVADSKTVRALPLHPAERGWTFSFRDPDGEPSRLEAMVLRPALGPGTVLATLHRNRPAKLDDGAPRPVQQRGQPAPPQPIERQPDWSVVALDRRTGRLVWDSAAAEPFGGWAREAEWIGPPLFHQGSVWVVAITRKTDLRAHLLRLDAASGRLRRATFLASRPGADPLGLGVPQAAPAVSPQGLIVVATGLGAVAAVEPALGEPAWVVRYPAVPDANLGALVQAQRRFRAGAPLCEREPVVVAPVDGVQVLALEGASGRPRWVAPREGARWCAAGPGGGVLLLGRTLRALDREGGRLRWVSPDLGGEAVAPPLVLGEEALVVLPDGLVRLSLSSGAELGRWRFDDPAQAGPAVLLGPGELGTIGVDQLHVWREQARPVRELDGQEQARADLPLGRALARRGQEEQALVHLERAGKSRQLDWTARLTARAEAWGLLAARAEAARARGDAATWLREGERALELAWGRGLQGEASEPDSPLLRDLRQRSAGLLLSWAQAQERGGGEEAAARGWRALLEVPDGTLAALPGVAARVDARAVARLHLRALAERAPQALAEAEAAATEALRAAQAAGSEEGLGRVAERFPWSARAADARWALARMHEARGRRKEASDELQALTREHPADPRRPEALARLAASLAAQERHAAAREALAALLALEPAPAVSGAEGAPAVPAPVWAEPLRARLLQGVGPRARDETRAAAGLEAPLIQVLRGPSELAQTGEALLVPPTTWGGAPELVLLERAGRLRALRLPDGDEVLRLEGVPPARGASGPVACGDLLLVPMGERLEAWRLQGPERGRRAWEVVVAPGDGQPLSERPVHELHPTEQGALVLGGRGDLFLLDAATGQERWRRRLPLHPSAGLVVAGGRAVAFSNAPAQAIAIELADGAAAWSWPGTPPKARLSGPVLVGDGLLACIEDGARVTSIDLDSGQPRWSVGCEGAWVTDLLPPPADGPLLARTQSWSGIELRALDARTGREVWRDEGTGGRAPGQAAPGGPVAALNLTVVGEAGVYTVRTVAGEQELWSQAPATGQLQWRWQLPRGGPTPSVLIETPTALLVPRGGAFGGRTTLTVLARGTGEVTETSTVPGRRLVGAWAQARAGTLLMTTDRGLFGFARRDDQALAREAARVGLELARGAGDAGPGDVAARLRLARLLSTAGRGEEALGLLEQGILAEGAGEEDVGRLGQLLAILSEDAADVRTPELSVRYLPRPPEIDGELNDWWRPWSGAELRRPRHVLPIQAEDGAPTGWAGTEDLSARVYLGWDARHFYFALDVEDSVLRPYDSEAERWLGDCLLIAIDCLGDGGEVVMNDDVLLSLALTLPRKKKDAEEQEGDEDKDRPQGTYFVRRKEDGSGAVYEAAIPWALFKEKGVALDLDRGPDAGLMFGLDLVLTDDDGERGGSGEPGGRGARQSLQLTPGVLLHQEKSRLWQGYVPDRFARLRLERPGSD